MNKTFLFKLSEGKVAEAEELARRINKVDSTAPLPNLVLALAAMRSGDSAVERSLSRSERN